VPFTMRAATKRAFTIGAVVTALTLIGSGVGGATIARKGPPKTTVKVTMIEFKVTAKPKSIKAGKVTFAVKNNGGIDHEFVVVRLPAPGAALPTFQDGSVNQTAIPATDVIGAIAKFKPHKTKKLVVASLTAGTYELLCNVVTPAPTSGGTALVHYARGMHSELTVR
jgi:uncharacterized cupredoxin-like copper-binding protein